VITFAGNQSVAFLPLIRKSYIYCHWNPVVPGNTVKIFTPLGGVSWIYLVKMSFPPIFLLNMHESMNINQAGTHIRHRNF